MVVISNWVGEHVFLRNDFPAEVKGKDGIIYPSVEHAFQAAKVDYAFQEDVLEAEKLKEQIRLSQSAREAKRFGKEIEIDSEAWDEARLDVMKDLVRRKFQQHEDLKAALLNTSGHDIVMRYRDAFWGDGGDESGENHQGKILMEVRDELLVEAKNAATGKFLDRMAKQGVNLPEPPSYASVGMRPHIRGKSAGKPDVAVKSPTPPGKKPIPLPPSSLPSATTVTSHNQQGGITAGLVSGGLPTGAITSLSGVPDPVPSAATTVFGSAQQAVGGGTANVVADSDLKDSKGYKDALNKICGDIDDL